MYGTEKNTTSKCQLNDAENKVLALSEVKDKQKLIQSLTDNQRGISFISDSTYVEGKPFYEIQIGYNSKERFENYYLFYVEKDNCDQIKILEPVEGDIISLEEWRNNNKNR